MNKLTSTHNSVNNIVIKEINFLNKVFVLSYILGKYPQALAEYE